MKTLFGLSLIVTGILFCFYVGGYLFFIKGFIQLVQGIVNESGVVAIDIVWGLEKMVVAFLVVIFSVLIFVTPGCDILQKSKGE